MWNKTKAALQGLVLCLAAFAISFIFPAFAVAQSDAGEAVGIIQKILSALPDWYQVLSAFGYALALAAALTPTVRDDEWSSGYKKLLAKLRWLLDVLGLSVGNANKQGKK